MILCRNRAICMLFIGLGPTAFSVDGGATYLGGQTSHWVGGVETDANGIWFFNWVTDGGDLRVAHFFGYRFNARYD